MKIIACIKQVPELWKRKSRLRAGKSHGGTRHWSLTHSTSMPSKARSSSGKPIAEAPLPHYALDLSWQREALKHALAMGADDAILVSDPALNELDTVGAARVLAAAIQKVGGVDMVVFGRQTLDNGAGITPAQTARILGMANAWVGWSDQGPGWKCDR